MSDGMDTGLGSRQGNELLTWIKADEHIRPLRDQIFVEPLELSLGTSLAVVYQGRPVRGIVRAAGPGRHPWKYFDSQGNPNAKRGNRKTQKLSKYFLPCDVKVGDVVDLGGLERDGNLFPRIRWGDIEVVICTERDVCLIDEDAMKNIS